MLINSQAGDHLKGVVPSVVEGGHPAKKMQILILHRLMEIERKLDNLSKGSHS